MMPEVGRPDHLAVDVVVQHPLVRELGIDEPDQRRAEAFAIDLARWAVRASADRARSARAGDHGGRAAGASLHAIDLSGAAVDGGGGVCASDLRIVALAARGASPAEPDDGEGDEEGEGDQGEGVAGGVSAEPPPHDEPEQEEDADDDLSGLLGDLGDADDPDLDALIEQLNARMGHGDDADAGEEAADALSDISQAAADGAIETDRVARHLERFLPGIGWSSAPGQLELSLLGQLEQLARLLEQLDELRDLADALGRLEEATDREGRRDGGREEVVGVRLGGEVATALPGELALLGDPDTEDLFYQRLLDRRLVSLELTGAGDEGRAQGDRRGPVIACIDTSASMEGAARARGQGAGARGVPAGHPARPGGAPDPVRGPRRAHRDPPATWARRARGDARVPRSGASTRAPTSTARLLRAMDLLEEDRARSGRRARGHRRALPGWARRWCGRVRRGAGAHAACACGRWSSATATCGAWSPSATRFSSSIRGKPPRHPACSASLRGGTSPSMTSTRCSRGSEVGVSEGAMEDDVPDAIRISAEPSARVWCGADGAADGLKIPTLRVVAGPDLLASYAIYPAERVLIGRDAECDLVLTDTSVSRQHAVVEWFRTASCFVEDLEFDQRNRRWGARSCKGLRAPADGARSSTWATWPCGSMRCRSRRSSTSSGSPSACRLVTKRPAHRPAGPGLDGRGAGKASSRATGRAAHRMAALFVDVDHFKASERHLRPRTSAIRCSSVVANLLVAGVRETDKVVRYGGEEFVVILCDCHQDDAAAPGGGSAPARRSSGTGGTPTRRNADEKLDGDGVRSASRIMGDEEGHREPWLERADVSDVPGQAAGPQPGGARRRSTADRRRPRSDGYAAVHGRLVDLDRALLPVAPHSRCTCSVHGAPLLPYQGSKWRFRHSLEARGHGRSGLRRARRPVWCSPTPGPWGHTLSVVLSRGVGSPRLVAQLAAWCRAKIPARVYDRIHGARGVGRAGGGCGSSTCSCSASRSAGKAVGVRERALGFTRVQHLQCLRAPRYGALRGGQADGAGAGACARGVRARSSTGRYTWRWKCGSRARAAAGGDLRDRHAGVPGSALRRLHRVPQRRDEPRRSETAGACVADGRRGGHRLGAARRSTRCVVQRAALSRP